MQAPCHRSTGVCVCVCVCVTNWLKEGENCPGETDKITDHRSHQKTEKRASKSC